MKNETKEKKISKKNKKVLLLIIGVIIILTIVIIVIMNIPNKRQNTDSNETNSTIEYEEKIDMNNIKNARVKDGSKINTSTKLKEEREYEGLKLENATLEATKYTVNFSVEVKNESEKKWYGRDVTLVLLDENDKELIKLETEIPTLEAGEIKNITATTDQDIVNAYDYRID